MDEKQHQPFQLSFDPSWKVDFQGSQVTLNGGLILARQLDERLGFSELIEQHLTDSRLGTHYGGRKHTGQTTGTAKTSCDATRRKPW
jgi:hypothetical protein